MVVDIERKRVLLISEYEWPKINGVSRRVKEYAEHLAEDGWKVDMLSPSSEDVFAYPNPYNPHIDMMSVKFSFYVRWALGRFAGRYDVVHAVCPFNVSAFLLFFVECIRRVIFGLENSPRLVVSYHTNCGVCFDYFMKQSMTPEFMFAPLKWIGMTFLGRPFGVIIDRVLTPTLVTEPDIMRFVEKDRHGIAASGVDVESFKIDGEIPEYWVRRRNQTLKEFDATHLCVYVGRVSYEKSVNELFHLFDHPRLNSDEYRVALWVVGDGPHMQDLRRIAARRKLPVKFLGYQLGDDLTNAYRASDLFVSASIMETFGQTVQEAIACGCPVAIPRTPVFDELFEAPRPSLRMWDSDIGADDMVRVVKDLLDRRPSGDVARGMLLTWKDASRHLANEYTQASYNPPSLFALICLLPNMLVWLCCDLGHSFTGMLPTDTFFRHILPEFLARRRKSSGTPCSADAPLFSLGFLIFFLWGFVQPIAAFLMFVRVGFVVAIIVSAVKISTHMLKHNPRLSMFLRSRLVMLKTDS